MWKGAEWPKSCDLNVQAYCSHIINAMDHVLPEMSSFCQPFDDFKKTKNLGLLTINNIISNHKSQRGLAALAKSFLF